MKSVLLRNLNCNPSQELLNDDTSNQNICIYSGCNLKCINGFSFCYQHISKKKPKIKDLKTTLVSKIDKTTCISNTISTNNRVQFDLSDESDDEELSREEKSNSIETNLNHASVYTRDEIIKIFKTKLSRLKYLYKQQLLILNDKLVIDHKRSLLRAKYGLKEMNEEKNITRNNPLRTYLNQRYNPLFKESKKSIFKQAASLCLFLVLDPSDKITQVKCNKTTIPFSNYCIDHVLNDENQVLFSECTHSTSDSTHKSVNLKHAIISSIGQACPLHFEGEPTNLDDTLVEYAQVLARRKANTNHHLISIKKKYLKNRVDLIKKRKLTISEIFSNSSIIIQKDETQTTCKEDTLTSIKDELIDNSDKIS